MAKDIKMNLQVGATRLVADTANYTYDKVCDLADRVADIRSKNSLFFKYPLEEGETKEDWAKRIEPLLQADLMPRTGESKEAHLKRLYGAKVDQHSQAFEILKAIAEVLCGKTITEEEFKQVNFIGAQKFIYDVLSLGLIPCEDFFPRMPSQS